MSMTKMHFQALAESVRIALNAHPESREAIKEVAEGIAHVARLANSRFDKDRFMEACGL
jgi:hypothetical protein